MIYKTLQKLKIGNTNPTKDRGMNSGAPEELVIPALLVAPAVLYLNDTNIIWYGNRVGCQNT